MPLGFRVKRTTGVSGVWRWDHYQLPSLRAAAQLTLFSVETWGSLSGIHLLSLVSMEKRSIFLSKTKSCLQSSAFNLLMLSKGFKKINRFIGGYDWHCVPVSFGFAVTLDTVSTPPGTVSHYLSAATLPLLNAPPTQSCLSSLPIRGSFSFLQSNFEISKD